MLKKTLVLMFNKLGKFEESKKVLGFSFVVVFWFFFFFNHIVFCCFSGNICAKDGVGLLFGQSTMLFNELKKI